MSFDEEIPEAPQDHCSANQPERQGKISQDACLELWAGCQKGQRNITHNNTRDKDEKQERFVGGIDKLERAITKVGGHSDTIKILGREATPKRLMAILKDLRCEDSDSLLIVTIYVHGSTDRLRLWGGEITKKQLTAALDKIPCKKVIIANTCHAEGYWNDNEIEDALVLLSSKSDELTYSSRFLDDVARFIERNLEEGKPVDFKELELAYEKQTPPTPKGRTALF